MEGDDGADEGFGGGGEDMGDDDGFADDPDDLADGAEDEDGADGADVGDDMEILDDSGADGSTGVAERVTTPFLTKYERARVLGTRALQISMNAPVMVDIAGETDPLKIAEKELREKKIPIVIRRYLPDGSHEDWPLRELIII